MVKTIPVHFSDLARTILLDIRNNRGTTQRQIQYRLKISLSVVNQVIEYLLAHEYIIHAGSTTKIDITEDGIASLSNPPVQIQY